MGFGWVFLLIGVLWLVQLVLAYLQARRFMARASAEPNRAGACR